MSLQPDQLLWCRRHLEALGRADHGRHIAGLLAQDQGQSADLTTGTRIRCILDFCGPPVGPTALPVARRFSPGPCAAAQEHGQVPADGL
eukprot:Skav208550  [mRNA]  locus=scaffold1216:557218:558670:- [translate_table: standard]